VTPLSTLAEWTNVLQLSSKWGFVHLRAAAQQALLPLMSPVDKLVLARTYGFTEWISDAYVGLLEREDDLDEEEVERMRSKDIVAIAKARLQACKANARSRAEILRVVQSILSPADAPVTSAPPAVPEPLVVQKKAKATVPTVTPLSDDAHTLVSRWVDQVTTFPSSGKACLSSYMKEDRSRVPLVLDLALQHAWKKFQPNIQLWCRDYSTSEYRPTWDDSNIGRWDEHLKDLQVQCRQLGLYHSHETISACLRFVDEWRGFRRLDLCQGINSIRASDEWQTLVHQTLFLGRFTIPNGRYKPPTNSVDASIHSTLWRAMTEFFTATCTPADPQRQTVVVQLLQAFLSKTRYCITRVESSWDTDNFYCVLEGALQETQDTTLRNLLQARIVQLALDYGPSSYSDLGYHQQSNGSLVADADGTRWGMSGQGYTVAGTMGLSMLRCKTAIRIVV
jgi:hypothetical protein